MPGPDSPYISLTRIQAVLVAAVCAGAGIVWGAVLLRGLAAERLRKKGEAQLRRAQGTAETLVTERALAVQAALKTFQRAAGADPFEPQIPFLIGEAAVFIARDPSLRASVDAGPLGVSGPEAHDWFLAAQRQYTHAVRRAPANAIYRQRLGSAQEALGDDEGARRIYERALSLDPVNVTLHLNLADFFYRRGQEREFREYLDRIVILYRKTLSGGGPVGYLGEMVTQYLISIGKKDALGL